MLPAGVDSHIPGKRVAVVPDAVDRGGEQDAALGGIYERAGLGVIAAEQPRVVAPAGGVQAPDQSRRPAGHGLSERQGRVRRRDGGERAAWRPVGQWQLLRVQSEFERADDPDDSRRPGVEGRVRAAVVPAGRRGRVVARLVAERKRPARKSSLRSTYAIASGQLADARLVQRQVGDDQAIGLAVPATTRCRRARDGAGRGASASRAAAPPPPAARSATGGRRRRRARAARCRPEDAIDLVRSRIDLVTVPRAALATHTAPPGDRDAAGAGADLDRARRAALDPPEQASCGAVTQTAPAPTREPVEVGRRRSARPPAAARVETRTTSNPWGVSDSAHAPSPSATTPEAVRPLTGSRRGRPGRSGRGGRRRRAPTVLSRRARSGWRNHVGSSPSGRASSLATVAGSGGAAHAARDLADRSALVAGERPDAAGPAVMPTCGRRGERAR